MLSDLLKALEIIRDTLPAISGSSDKRKKEAFGKEVLRLYHELLRLIDAKQKLIRSLNYILGLDAYTASIIRVIMELPDNDSVSNIQYELRRIYGAIEEIHAKIGEFKQIEQNNGKVIQIYIPRMRKLDKYFSVRETAMNSLLEWLNYYLDNSADYAKTHYTKYAREGKTQDEQEVNRMNELAEYRDKLRSVVEQFVKITAELRKFLIEKFELEELL